MEIPTDRPFLAAEVVTSSAQKRALRDLRERGTVRLVLRGVYADAALPDTVELRATAAALVLPSHVVVSDRTAAWIHGVDLFHVDVLVGLPELELVSVQGSRTRRRDTLGGKRDLAAGDICVIGGVRVTTPLRTACDLACLRGRSQALAVLDVFMREHGLSRGDYRRMAARFAGRRGVIQLRELIEYADPGAESMAESWTRMKILDAGLPKPRLQHWVELPGYGRVRLDLAYPKAKIAMEYDGVEHHSSDKDRTADEERRAALRAAGWLVIVVRREDLRGDRLHDWISQLRAALAARQPVQRRVYSRGESLYGGRRRTN